MSYVASDARPSVGSPLGRDDAGLVERGLKALGWRQPIQAVAKLAGGGSGAQVFLLDTVGERVVLKVTEGVAWQDRAKHELTVYRELGSALEGFLPALRGAQVDDHAVRLLLTAYEPLPPAVVLTDDLWVAIADRLGRLQSTPIPPSPWLSRRGRPSPQQVTQAVRLWTGRGLGSLAARAAAQLTATEDADAHLSPVLTHGDCHLRNLLLDHRGLIRWVDWQEGCLSTGLDDLVFLWQRAEFEGAHPPREPMIAAYAAGRELPDDDAFRAALVACELRLLLVAWPSFLTFGSSDRQKAMIHRLEQLVDQRV